MYITCIYGNLNVRILCVCVSDCEDKGVTSSRLVACITTLFLFSKIRAQLMVKHAMTMQPYLTTKCNVRHMFEMKILFFSYLTDEQYRIEHQLLCCIMGPSSGSQMKTPVLKTFFLQLSFVLSCVFMLSFQTQNDFMVICNVAKILELVVPLMEHPSETFLTTMEEDLMKLIIKYGMTVCHVYAIFTSCSFCFKYKQY